MICDIFQYLCHKKNKNFLKNFFTDISSMVYFFSIHSLSDELKLGVSHFPILGKNFP